jgi:hypothetical protein
MHLDEYKKIVITVDNRKHKGKLGKEKFRQDILEFLCLNFKGTDSAFVFQASTTNILLELADFYSNIFYEAYQGDENSFLRDCRPRIYQLKNPLKKLTDILS